MDNIHIDMTHVQKKFSLLIVQQKHSKKTTSIGQLIQVITQNKVLAQDVYQYLTHIQDSQQNIYAERISQNWKTSSIDEIKKLLDNVIFYKNNMLQKNQPSQKSPQKKKSKFKNDAHQNPYIPPKIQVFKKSNIKQKNVTNNINQQENLLSSLEQKQTKQNYQQQQQVEIEHFHQKNSDNKNQQNSEQQEQSLFRLDNFNGLNTKDQLNLPQNFKSLPVQQRYSILSKKQGKNKKILQKRFDMIYKHYRKEMYIPYESFQINNELLIDLRIFLKYFKDFDISKKFKTNQALKCFKKIAINGLWLDDKNFISLHYKLIELLDTNLLLSNFNSTDPKKVNQMKKETVKNIKRLKENLKKLNQLSQLVSQDKMKQVFRTGKTQTIVNKIIESHPGLSQQDVMLKLKERAELRKNKKAQINSNEKVSTWSPDKSKFIKTNDATSQRFQLLHEVSIYKQIQLPKFRSREMRNSSIYSSLEILNIQKEKQRLRQLVRQKDNERYLQLFFKKQKNSPILCRSNSLNVDRSSIKEQTQSLFINSSIVSRKSGLPQINLLKKNFSLPRMRFT